MWGRAEGVRADGPGDQGAWERKRVQRWRPAALRRLRARRPRSLAPPAGHRPTSRSPTLNQNSPGWGLVPSTPWTQTPGCRRTHNGPGGGREPPGRDESLQTKRSGLRGGRPQAAAPTESWWPEHSGKRDTRGDPRFWSSCVLHAVRNEKEDAREVMLPHGHVAARVVVVSPRFDK